MIQDYRIIRCDNSQAKPQNSIFSQKINFIVFFVIPNPEGMTACRFSSSGSAGIASNNEKSNSNFLTDNYKQMENIDKNCEDEKNDFEIMEIPEIAVKEEENAQLLSIMLTAYNPARLCGGNDLVQETKKYFLENPLDPEIIDFLKKVEELNVDTESLYNLALAYKNPERTEKVLQMIKEYKPQLKNPEEALEEFSKIIEKFKNSFYQSALSEKFRKKTDEDKKRRLEMMSEYHSKIENLIKFFKPDNQTTNIKKIFLMPTDPLSLENSGRNFNFGDETIIKNNINNIGNFEHEFLHNIINPIVKKLSNKLKDEQKNNIWQLTSEGLIQDYGKGHFSILCEEFIRTYLETFAKGEKPLNSEEFQKSISDSDEQDFKKECRQNPKFKERCEELKIKTIDDFKDKSKMYFEKFKESKLHKIIFEIYEDYSKSKNGQNFEQFVLENFTSKIFNSENSAQD